MMEDLIDQRSGLDDRVALGLPSKLEEAVDIVGHDEVGQLAEAVPDLGLDVVDVGGTSISLVLARGPVRQLSGLQQSQSPSSKQLLPGE